MRCPANGRRLAVPMAPVHPRTRTQCCNLTRATIVDARWILRLEACWRLVTGCLTCTVCGKGRYVSSGGFVAGGVGSLLMREYSMCVRCG